MRRLVGEKAIEEKTMVLLKQSARPVSIEYIARTLKISWATARAVLLTLMVDGRVSGQRTTTSWVFQKGADAA